MRPTRRCIVLPIGWFSLAIFTIACGDDGAESMSSTGASTSSSGAGSVDVGATGSGDAGTTGSADGPADGTTDAGTTAADDGASTSTTTGMGGACETTLCGDLCCDGEDECVNEQCVLACETEVRCGDELEICCDEGQVCLAGACATPAGACVDSLDCEDAEFCEPTLDQCLPLRVPANCEVPLQFSGDVVPKWSFEEDETRTIPIIGDVDGDALPEVIINTWNATDPDGASAAFYGEIVVLDGTTGLEQFRIQDDPASDSFGSYGRTTPGIADMDGDGTADIIYSGRPQVNIPPFPNNASLIHAVDGFGQHLWTSHAPDDSEYFLYARHGAPAFANLDDDDASEIIWGTTIIDNDGTVVFDQDNASNLGGAVFGSNGNFLGGIASVADLTGDGYPEIVTGHQAWTVSWSQVGLNPPDVELNLLWEYPGPDGLTAIADLDADGDPEVVLVGDPAPFNQPFDGQLQILDGATGELWCGIDPSDVFCEGNPALRTQPIPIRGHGAEAGGRGGPPTIGDFDGDGRLEIGVAGATHYSVYDLNRVGETIVQPAGDAPPAAGAIFVRWTVATEDTSTHNTGSSAFDFQGDGTAEILYGDECYARVYGDDGNVLLELEHSNATIHEYPIVADVDDDGSSELVVVANDFNAAGDCGAIPGYTPSRGVFVYGSLSGRWARTRSVWNTHGYHVTNSGSTGLTPTAEANHWEDPSLNHYRQNYGDPSMFNAPNLEVGLSMGLANCRQDEIEVIATVRNTGSIGLPAGVDVSLYQGTDATGLLVSTQPTEVALLPGAQTDVQWTEPNTGQPQDYYVEIDADADMPITECQERNNSAVATSVACPDPAG